MDAIYTYQGEVASEIDRIKPFLEEILCGIKKYIVDEETIFDIKLILDELVVNGALHGNELDKKKRVRLKIVLRNSSITIKVMDEGSGINYSANEDCFTAHKCCGRGLVLVKALTDSMVFRNNEVICLKHF